MEHSPLRRTRGKKSIEGGKRGQLRHRVSTESSWEFILNAHCCHRFDCAGRQFQWLDLSKNITYPRIFINIFLHSAEQRAMVLIANS